MKRYTIKVSKNTIAEDHGLVTAELKQFEDEDGEWVRYEDVKDDLHLLSALFAAGVDNWDGYEHAQEMVT